MAQPTSTQIRDRIVTMCAAISGIKTAQAFWPESEDPFAAAQLPAIVVTMSGVSTSNTNNPDVFVMDREITLMLLAARFPSDYKIRDDDTWEAVDPFLVSIPSYFNRRRRLEHNDSGLAHSITIPSARQVAALALDRALYASADFRFNVRTIHR